MNIAQLMDMMISALEKGQIPKVGPDDLPCFSIENLHDNPLVALEALPNLLESLSAEDIPTLERARLAAEEGEHAWLGFKIVLDAEQATERSTEGEWMLKFDTGSADGESGIFFDNEKHEIVSARPVSKRDIFQMNDITSGPAMHSAQFPGLTWLAIPLFQTERVLIFGAGDVSCYLARYARDCGFEVVVLDDDASYLNEARFPQAKRQLIDFAKLGELQVTVRDYVCVVTRGHVHDPETLLFAAQSQASYVGMMGHPAKVEKNFNLLREAGVAEERIAEIHAPIGIKCGGNEPAELAVSIIAELIKVRKDAQKAARARIGEALEA